MRTLSCMWSVWVFARRGAIVLCRLFGRQGRCWRRVPIQSFDNPTGAAQKGGGGRARSGLFPFWNRQRRVWQTDRGH